MAHVHVNWLSPTKIRQLVVGGSRRTLVWDDLNPQQRLSVYDRGVSLERQSRPRRDRKASAISYRLGDTWSPALPEHEALGARWWPSSPTASGSSGPPRTSGASGLRVLSVLEAVSDSLSADGNASIVVGNEPRSWRPADEHAAGRAGPRHRRSRNHRLHHRRPPARRRRRQDRRAGQPGPRPAGQPRPGDRQRAGRARRRGPPRPGPGPRPEPGQGHRLPPGGDPDHPVRRGTPAGPRGAGGRDLQRARSRGGAAGRQARGRLQRLGLWHGGDVSDAGTPPPPQQRHVLRRRQVVQRGHGPQLPCDVRTGLRAVAVLQRVRTPDGRPRALHRGAGALDGAHRGRAAAADLRRRTADHGLRPHPGRGPRQHPGRGQRRGRRCVQRRQRRGDQPAGTGRGAVAGHGLGPARGARPRAGRQRRRPAPGRHGRRRRDLGFSAETGLEDGLRELVDWWRPLRIEIADARVGGAR